jgi:hypothetical protein
MLGLYSINMTLKSMGLTLPKRAGGRVFTGVSEKHEKQKLH